MELLFTDMIKGLDDGHRKDWRIIPYDKCTKTEIAVITERCVAFMNLN